MSLPRYPRYKNSGAEWLGEVPEHWVVQRFRHLFRESQEKIEGEVLGPMLSVSGYRGIEVKEYDDENRKRSDAELVGYRIVRVGQLVVNTMWLNYAGLGVSDLDGHVSPAYRSYWITDAVSRRFTHHLLRSETYVQGYTRLLTGIRPNSLQMSRDDLMDFPIIYPPWVEQHEIAAFLDGETIKIDALVSKQRRLIELLKEKRQAVISHAVTRGLTLSVLTKPSGIEWMGDVPAHWEVLPIKRVINVIEQGWSPQCEGYPADDVKEWGVLKVGCVNGGVFRASENKLLPGELEPIPELGIRKGDVLISRANTRELVGSAAVATQDYPRLMLCDKLYRIRINTEQCLPEFLSLFLGSSQARSQIELGASGASASMLNIGQATILGMPIPVPPIAEQRRIVDFLNATAVASASLTSEAERAIALLQERRATLISAAVTGKIDVRGLAEAA